MFRFWVVSFSSVFSREVSVRRSFCSDTAGLVEVSSKVVSCIRKSRRSRVSSRFGLKFSV